MSFTESILPSERSYRTEPDMTSDVCESEQIVKSIVWFPLHYLTMNTYQVFPNDNPDKSLSAIKYSQYKTFNEISVFQASDSTMLDDHPTDQQQQQQQQSQDPNNFMKISLSRPIRPDK
ncbi:unnamed protein product, partial [Trichobilharzia regenti]